MIFPIASYNIAFAVHCDIFETFKFAIFRSPRPERFDERSVGLDNYKNEQQNKRNIEHPIEHKWM